MRSVAHLEWLESESIHVIREATAEAERPVMLFSAGKDSTVLAHLALRAFYPGKPPFALLHIDSTWEFRSLLEFRDAFARENGFSLVVHANEEGRVQGINPFDYGDRYTMVMRTEPLKEALNRGGYDVIFGGARRDEEKSRAKERIVSVRNTGHVWDPRQQRPEFWRQYNLRLSKGQSARVFPLSNWTENDIWSYALLRKINLAPLYFALPKPVVERNGAFIVVDDELKMRFQPGDKIEMKTVRFRTLGCWPVTGAIESTAKDIDAVLEETLAAKMSERQGRISDGEDGGSLEQKKREGYF
ncbi:sulfate adenylyltransferase subunit CysD [Methylocystis sp. ATCC 49242]|uniref:sulfate adenylyltransferase subunit CysD n=1 Tax=Methylocystis sp. ATCC 49242 TaxID=622637 RepID=UPI00055D446B|nr:sulfate adenylyltransferase subunit CysD [Methylocystis sp. ATCC 49242]